VKFDAPLDISDRASVKPQRTPHVVKKRCPNSVSKHLLELVYLLPDLLRWEDLVQLLAVMMQLESPEGIRIIKHNCSQMVNLDMFVSDAAESLS
jgi:hypothetical protein